MQLTLWSRERLEGLCKDLLDENKRLHRINWGRAIGLAFFTFWIALVCVYFFSPAQNSQSCKCAVKACNQSK